MNLTLSRGQYRKDGIFGELSDDSTGERIAVTLEHAYPVTHVDLAENQEGYAPKVPPGTYTCQRGFHRLHGMNQTFATFEIQGVPDCTGILFHWGNFNKDSEGCVLLGRDEVEENPSINMLTRSKDAFAAFMSLCEGIETFTLKVQ